jgi:Cu(I)/Ag(I) efflux system periplasmic protein CusF
LQSISLNREQPKVYYHDQIQDAANTDYAARCLPSGMKMPGMQMSSAGSTQNEKLGHTTGKVLEIDVARSRVTIKHHEVPALGWPAMTMAFQATSQQLKGIRADDQVEFEFYVRGGAAVIERIRKIG